MMLTLEMNNWNIKYTFRQKQKLKTYPPPFRELSPTMATSEKMTEEEMKQIADGPFGSNEYLA